jgi:twitching motility protein PilT
MAKMNVNELLQLMIKKGISDIHFKAQTPPLIRINGKIVSTNFNAFTPKNIEELAYSLMNEEQKARFETECELDMSYSIDEVSRFRINVYKQRGSLALTLRVVPLKVKSFEELNLPVDVLRKLSSERRGLILIAGITGAGKTTTLNSMVDYINENFAYNVITVEDPIEYYHSDKKASVSQREIGADTKSYKNALKYILRQDPDVIVIGEMREFEALSAGITAAETGHLVISTIHTIDSIQTIDRIIDMYPQHQQNQVRSQLAGVIKAVVCQRLCYRQDIEGRIPAIEILIGTSLVRKLILENKSSEIYKAIEQGEYYGMRTFDQDLNKLFKEKKINMEEAIDKAANPEDLMLKLKGIFRDEDSGGGF